MYLKLFVICPFAVFCFVTKIKTFEPKTKKMKRYCYRANDLFLREDYFFLLNWGNKMILGELNEFLEMYQNERKTCSSKSSKIIKIYSPAFSENSKIF